MLISLKLALENISKNLFFSLAFQNIWFIFAAALGA